MEDKVICCGVLEELDMEWMVTKDGTVLMPFIEGKDGIRYRVNYYVPIRCVWVGITCSTSSSFTSIHHRMKDSSLTRYLYSALGIKTSFVIIHSHVQLHHSKYFIFHNSLSFLSVLQQIFHLPCR